MSVETCDFLVVGAGSAGCVLANRLSADPANQVVLLEAGPRDRNFWIHLPIGYGKTMWDPVLNWRFYTEPEPNMDGRKIYWPRGRVLGGSSSINGLIAIRGQREDYERWRALGNQGWSWSDVLPYFIKLERNDDLAGDQQHGASGPVSVTSIGRRHELIEAFIGAAQANGVPRTEDFNGRSQEGAGYYQLTTRRGWRMSSAQAYLRPVETRPNLKVLADSHACRVLFEGARAVGVEVRRGGTVRTIKARRGVILSAGAIQSPQLLMLSGVGPGSELRRFDIPVVVNRPEVGRNLQDHLQFRLIYRCSKPITTNDDLNSLPRRVWMGLEWALFRRGPLAVGINQGGLFGRLMPGATSPDIQFHVATLSADMAGGQVHPYSGFTLSVCQLRPESRGQISLASADPLAAPRIEANYLATDFDRDFAVKSIAFARRLASTRPLADYVAEEILPGAGAKTDADMLAFARRSGATIFHPSGTCRMGPDQDAVVDPRLRVRGTEALWVVDCSIMPTLVSGNTNLPVMMIAEKASDMILEDSQENITAGTTGRTSWPTQEYRKAM